MNVNSKRKLVTNESLGELASSVIIYIQNNRVEEINKLCVIEMLKIGMQWWMGHNLISRCILGRIQHYQQFEFMFLGKNSCKRFNEFKFSLLAKNKFQSQLKRVVGVLH